MDCEHKTVVLERLMKTYYGTFIFYVLEVLGKTSGTPGIGINSRLRNDWTSISSALKHRYNEVSGDPMAGTGFAAL